MPRGDLQPYVLGDVILYVLGAAALSVLHAGASLASRSRSSRSSSAARPTTAAVRARPRGSSTIYSATTTHRNGWRRGETLKDALKYCSPLSGGIESEWLRTNYICQKTRSRVRPESRVPSQRVTVHFNAIKTYLSGSSVRLSTAAVVNLRSWTSRRRCAIIPSTIERGYRTANGRHSERRTCNSHAPH